MKWNGLKIPSALAFAWLVLMIPTLARADEAEPAAPETQHKSFSGNVRHVDERERTITVSSFLVTRSFTAGDHCRVQLDNMPSASLKDLHPGRRVEVRYLTSDGVNVAARIIQKNESFTGHISSLHATGKTFKVKHGLSTKAFALGELCKIVSRETKAIGFADLKLGQKVTVGYAPGLQQNVAFKIEQNSLVFIGNLEALDSGNGTLRARQMLAVKSFKFSGDCPIIVDGRAGAKLRDLRIGDKLSFHYEDHDGVLIANRIALETPGARNGDPQQLTRQ